MPGPESLVLLRSWEVLSAWSLQNAPRGRDLSYELVEEAVLSWMRMKSARSQPEWQAAAERFREFSSRLPTDLASCLFPPADLMKL